jgi:hypothetical protein
MANGAARERAVADTDDGSKSVCHTVAMPAGNNGPRLDRVRGGVTPPGPIDHGTVDVATIAAQ